MAYIKLEERKIITIQVSKSDNFKVAEGGI